MAGLRAQVAVEAALVAAGRDPSRIRLFRAWSDPDVPPELVNGERPKIPYWICILPDGRPLPLAKDLENSVRIAADTIGPHLPALTGVWGAGKVPAESPEEVARRAAQAKIVKAQRDREARQAKAHQTRKERAMREAIARDRKREEQERRAAESRKVPEPRRRARAVAEEPT